MCPADSLCIGIFFLSITFFSLVIHSQTRVLQSSIFRVVDMLCAVSYTVAEDEWISSSPLWIFFHVCHGLRPCSSLSDPRCFLQTPCVSADFFLSIVDFFLPFTPGHFCITPVCSDFRVADVLCAVSPVYSK